MPLKHKVAIGIGVAFGIIILIILILILLHHNKWPIHFSISSSENIIVDIYANDMEAFLQQKIIPGKVHNYEINSHNVKNTRTGKYITRDQLKHIVVYVPHETDITFNFGNIPDHKVVLAKDRSGFSIIENNTQNLRDGVWKQAGYYLVNFPQGVPVV